MHTTASDGTLSPAALVEAAATAGLSTIAITDHDTVDGFAEASAAGVRLGVTVVPGIEITAIEEGRDVHVLGYFFDPGHPTLQAFVATQRADRVRRVQVMSEQLAAVGVPIDVDPILRMSLVQGRSVGRPHVAEALLAAGHVATLNEAFDRFIGQGCPAFVPRVGATAAEVVRVVAAAGGICSLAHPGVTRVDELIPGLAAAGLAALEAHHSDHDGETERRYRALAGHLDLAVSGGSDFHGEGRHHCASLGEVTLPAEDFEDLLSRRRGRRDP